MHNNFDELTGAGSVDALETHFNEVAEAVALHMLEHPSEALASKLRRSQENANTAEEMEPEMRIDESQSSLVESVVAQYVKPQGWEALAVLSVDAAKKEMVDALTQEAGSGKRKVASIIAEQIIKDAHYAVQELYPGLQSPGRSAS